MHDDERRTPLHHMTVDLLDRDLLGPDDRLGRGVTDAEGRFELHVDPAGAGYADRPDLELHVVEFPWDMRVDEERGDSRVVARFPLADDFTGAALDAGELVVAHWEYQDDTPARLRLPDEECLLHITKELKIGVSAVRDLLRIDREDEVQRYARGYADAFAEVAARIGLIRLGHELVTTVDEDRPSLQSIQEDYPDSLTTRMERVTPGASRSDAYFCDRLLNGFNPHLPLRCLDDPTRLRVLYDWSAYPLDGEHDLPDVDLELELRDGALRPVSIRSRLDGWERVTATEDGEDWQRAMRLFRVAALTAGETDAHLSRGHLNAEQFAVAAFRNLRASPLAELLFPHLKEVVLTNHRGAALIFGSTGVLKTNSGLTAAGVKQRLVERVGELDWKDWRPRRPLHDDHRFAWIANLYWDVLGEHVDAFFERHEAGLREHWLEVRRFSDDLVRHAVPHHRTPPPPGWAWYDERELGGAPDHLPLVDGVRRALSPIATEDTATLGQLADLRQACRFAIYHASFWHSWCHNRQVDDGGELRYASLGLRNGSWGSEFDEDIAPRPVEATLQLFMAHVLGGVQYGYVTADEDGDVSDLARRLRARRGDFARHGFDIDELRSRTNI